MEETILVPRLTNIDDLIRSCQNGDAAAFGELFDHYHRRVFTVAYALTADYAAASDTVQEVFVKLLTRISQFHFAASFDTWLHRIVLNTAYDQKRAPRAEPLEEISAEPPQQRSMERDEIERSVRGAIRSLTPKLREPIVLRYISELSYDEIASVLEISPGTVASRLARAHAALAKQLEHLR